jgi:HD-GYP domain-containing protein (c-di-GMP phosphodiesterase class II)
VFLVDLRWLKKTSREDDAGAHDHSANRSGSAWLAGVVRRARDQGKALVEAPPTGAAPDWVTETLVGPVFAGDRSGAESSSSFVGAIVLARNTDVDAFRASDMLLLDSLTRFCGDLIRNQRLVLEVREMSLAMVRSLVNAVDQKDAYTSGHSLRVGYFATLLGKALRLKGTDLRMLQWSALLHDIGKIGIRDDVLKKPGKLTKEEFDHIKEHPERSHRVVQEVRQLSGALDGVLHHHERYDGTGYPAGLTGEDIPLQARIIQVADVFDALTSTRSYRPAFNWRDALDLLEKEAGRTIDPNLQGIFDGLIRESLEGIPDGWEKMIQSANRFTEVDGEQVPGINGE